MIRKIVFLVLALLVITVYGAQGSIPSSESVEPFRSALALKVDEIIDKALELNLFSGCVLIAKGDEILYSRACGEANRDWHIPNSLDTRFNIASGTKPFTSVAVMLLVQQGRLSLNDSVKKHLPDFPFGDQITLFHCLTHTSGLGHYTSEYNQKMHQIRGFQAFLDDFIYKEKPLFEPGSRFEYSNSGVVVLGAVIEKVSGMKYADFLKTYIFDPLDMKDTVHRMPEEIIEKRASGYLRKLSGGFVETSLTVCPPTSATGLRTTAPDLFKFIRGIHRNRLLKEEYKKIMFTPFKNDDLGPYALLWDVIPDGIRHKTGNTVIGHRGGQDGFTSWYTYYDKDEISLVLLSNLDRGVLVLYPRLEAVLFDQEYGLPKPPADSFLYNLLKKEPLDEDPPRLLERLKQEDISIEVPRSLNGIGYQLIREGDLPMALRIFRLNTRLFPDDANVWDSLAEACMLNGRIGQAVEYYEKTLVMNPDNPNAREMLKKLKEKQALVR